MIIPNGQASQSRWIRNFALTLLLSATTAAVLLWQVKSRFAPEGTLFLLEAGMVRTENGVTGFPAGTHVNIVSDEGDHIAVSAEGMEFHVPRRMLTNRIALGEAAAVADRESQRTARRLVLEQQSLARASNGKSALAQETRQREIASRRAVSLTSGALNRAAYDEKRFVSRPPVIYWSPIP